MNIVEATKLIVGTGKQIRRRGGIGTSFKLLPHGAFKILVPNDPERNNNDCIGHWNPNYEDILADDWEVCPE